MNNKSKKILKNQKKVVAAIIGGVLFLSLGVGYLLLGDSNYPKRQTSKTFDLPADKMNPQDIWMNRVDSQNQLFDQKIKYLEDLVLEGKKQKESEEREKRELKKEISLLKQELTKACENPPPNEVAQLGDPMFMPPPTLPPPPMIAPLVEFSMAEPTSTIRNVANAIPSGTTVKALLVSSLDANCGVYSINDPIPVKLRILDDGHLPKNIDVNLKGGIIIGSAYGDLSSERVYMRIERLTQVNSKGDFVESEVLGYITGEDGKYGVRGTVVDKSEKIIANAAISGLFGEASEILQSAVGRWRIDNYLSANQAVNDPFVPGIGGGTSNAFDMLADYYIQRAEQIEPVIQVNAGRIVDITFTHGIDIGELHAKERIQEVREKSRRCQ